MAVADTVTVELQARVDGYVRNLKRASDEAEKTARVQEQAATRAAAAITRQAQAQLAALRASGTATKEQIASAQASVLQARASEQATRAEVALAAANRSAAVATSQKAAASTRSATTSRANTLAARAEASAVNSLRGAFAAYLGVQGVQAAVALADANTRIANSLKVVGLEGAELTRVYDRLFASAQRNLAPFETLTTLYSRLGLAQKELGATNEELLQFTDRIALALRVQGGGAEETRGALIQLSQALGGGIVRAEEFNSIVEGAPTILRATAAGLEEAGGSVAKLRGLVLDGKVSSEAFFNAFLSGSHILEGQVANAQVTVAQGFVRLQNVLIDVAGEFNETSNVSGVLVSGLEDLGIVITDVAGFVEYIIGPLQQLSGLLGDIQSGAQGAANELARISGLERFGAGLATGINNLGIPGLTAGSSAGGRVLDQTFRLLGERPQDEALARALAGETTEPIKVEVERPRTVSLSDYDTPIPPGGTGTGRSGTSPADTFAQALEQQRQQIAALREETALRSTLNPLVNDYGYALERLKVQQELENEAKRAGLELDAERQAAISVLADAYATASVEAAQLAEAQQRLRDTTEEWAGIAQDATRTFINDLIEGKTAAEALGNVLQNLGNQLINLGLNSLLGGSGGGLLGGLISGARANGGPVNGGSTYLVGERGPELFTPSSAGRITSNADLQGGGGFTFAPVVDARGADVAAVARLESSLRRLASDMVPTIRKEIAVGPKKGR